MYSQAYVNPAGATYWRERNPRQSEKGSACCPWLEKSLARTAGVNDSSFMELFLAMVCTLRVRSRKPKNRYLHLSLSSKARGKPGNNNNDNDNNDLRTTTTPALSYRTVMDI